MKIGKGKTGRKKKAIISSIITVLCIVAAVFLRVAMEDTNP